MRPWPLLSLLVASFACSSSGSPEPAPAPPADAAAPLPALGMNDVSVLFPIPAKPTVAGTIGPTDEGAKGPLLPKAVYDEIPKFGVEPVEGLDFARMRVVSARFDGCFPGKSGCEAQIRLVMQPITDRRETLDSAIHLFYRLTLEELADVVTGLRKLRALAPELADAPLDVNAALVAQGVDGPYGAGLRELILAYAGEANLSRMTFFLRAPPLQEEWFFGGFDRRDGALTRIDIVGVGPNNQRVDRPDVRDGYAYEFTPAGNKPENVAALLSSAAAKAAAPADLTSALGAFARLENPTKYGPDALPCAGCHVTTFITEHARTALSLDPSAMPDAFTSKRDLTLKGEAAKTPSSLRAFGWFDKSPMISKRVVNETAVVVDDLEARFPR